MADKPMKPESEMTPTELFQLEWDRRAAREEAAKAPPPAAYNAYTNPLDAEGLPNPTLAIGNDDQPSKIQAFKDKYNGANDSYRQFRADHPLAEWALKTAPAVANGLTGPLGLVNGAIGNGEKPLPPPTGLEKKEETPSAPRSMQSFERTGSETDSRGYPVSMLPDAVKQSGYGAMMGSTSERTGLGSDKALQNAQKDRIYGQQALVDKKMDEAAAQEKYLDHQAQTVEDVAKLRALHAAYQKEADDSVVKEQQDYADKIQESRDAAAKMGVDPGRMFRDHKVGWAIGMALGGAISGMLAALNNQPNNPFIDHVRGLVQQDIDNQDKDIAQAWKKTAGMETTYQNLVRRGVDKRVAQSTYYGQVLDANETFLKGELMKTQIPVEKARIEATIQGIQNERSAMDANMQEYWKGVYEKRSAAAAAASAAAAERLWRHNMEFQELNIKKYNAETGRMEATGKADAKNGLSMKDLSERAVVLDGKDTVAQTKKAAEDWKDYSHGRAVFNTALEGMKAARERGDVGAYNNYRATLIEEYPKLLGYTKAPTQGQIKVTLGPEAIPEYNHWYDHAKYGGPIGAISYNTAQGRAAEKLRAIDETLATSDKAMRENTFGADAPTVPKMPATVKVVE